MTFDKGDIAAISARVFVMVLLAAMFCFLIFAVWKTGYNSGKIDKNEEIIKTLKEEKRLEMQHSR